MDRFYPGKKVCNVSPNALTAGEELTVLSVAEDDITVRDPEDNVYFYLRQALKTTPPPMVDSMAPSFPVGSMFTFRGGTYRVDSEIDEEGDVCCTHIADQGQYAACVHITDECVPCEAPIKPDWAQNPQPLYLSPEAFAKIQELVENPPAPSSRLKEAVQALRHNANKPELTYLLKFGDALREFAKVCMYGANKYEANNWIQGAPHSQSTDCLLRHLLAWQEGEERDPESGQLHLAHVVWNALRLLQESIVRPDLDDRYSYQHAEKEKP